MLSEIEVISKETLSNWLNTQRKRSDVVVIDDQGFERQSTFKKILEDWETNVSIAYAAPKRLFIFSDPDEFIAAIQSIPRDQDIPGLFLVDMHYKAPSDNDDLSNVFRGAEIIRHIRKTLDESIVLGFSQDRGFYLDAETDPESKRHTDGTEERAKQLAKLLGADIWCYFEDFENEKKRIDSALFYKRLRGVLSDQIEFPDLQPDIYEGKDAIGIGPEVDAFASLIAANSTKLPISIAVLAPWGTGKSFFIRELIRRIREHSGNNAINSAASDEEGERYFVEHIAHIEFNAWHYRETDIWSSLTVHILEELDKYARRIDQESDKHRQENYEAARQAAKTAQDLHREAQEELTESHSKWVIEKEALSKLEKKEAGNLIQVSGLDLLFQSLRNQLLPYVTGAFKSELEDIDNQDVKGALERIQIGIEDLKSPINTIFRFGKSLFPIGKSRSIVTATGLVIGVIFFIEANLNFLDRIFSETTAYLIGSATLLLPFLYNGLSQFKNVAEVVKNATETFGKAREEVAQRQIDELKISKLKEIAKKQLSLENAEKRFQHAKRELDVAEEAWLQVDKTYYYGSLVAERIASGDYHRNLGVLTKIRSDFEHLRNALKIDLKLNEADAIDGNNGEKRALDRIVLYVDDLDRCSSERVVEVLTCLHLLASIDLFFIIVAIDEDIVERSIEKWYQRHYGLENEELKDKSLPRGFMDKVFQIAYRLPPFEREGYVRLLEALIPENSVAIDSTGDSDSLQSEVKNGQSEAREENNNWQAQENKARLLSSKTLRPVVITASEQELLEAFFPVVGTPRNTKRLVNTWRLIKACSAGKVRGLPAFSENNTMTIDQAGLLVSLGLVTGEIPLCGFLITEIRKAKTSMLETCFDKAIKKMNDVGRPDVSISKIEKLKDALAQITMRQEPLTKALRANKLQILLEQIGGFSFRDLSEDYSSKMEFISSVEQGQTYQDNLHDS